MGKIVQTVGREQLGDFAPEFAYFNDDILFGENWNNDDIDLKTRCIITVTSLMSQGITDSSLKYHLENAKAQGVTKKEIALSSRILAFIRAGQMPGRCSAWQRKYGQRRRMTQTFLTGTDSRVRYFSQ